MRLDIVRDIFEPVVERIKSQCVSGCLRSYLSDRYGSDIPRTAGIESWFGKQVATAIGDLLVRLWNKGPDLELRDGNSTVWLELKAAADLNPTYLRDGATKYCDPKYTTKYPNFEGCLFLGDGSDESQIDKLSEGDVELIARQTIPDVDSVWVVGLLVSSKSRLNPTQESTMSKPRIAVVFGSDSDWPVMEECVAQLRAFDERPFVEVMSAHRNPDRCAAFASSAEADGLEVIIAAAGMSNALAGAIAAHTVLPVIGIPLVSGSMDGTDALLSTVQMPPGIPVACVSIGGAKNAALLAIQIIARHDESLAKRYSDFKADQAKGVADKNAALQAKMRS